MLPTRCRAPTPSELVIQISLYPVAKAIWLPSGDHVGVPAAKFEVIVCAPVPSGFITHTRPTPSRVLKNAMLVPSGENSACPSFAKTEDVSRRRFPPSGSTTNRSLWASTRSFVPSGDQSSTEPIAAARVGHMPVPSGLTRTIVLIDGKAIRPL